MVYDKTEAKSQLYYFVGLLGSEAVRYRQTSYRHLEELIDNMPLEDFKQAFKQAVIKSQSSSIQESSHEAKRGFQTYDKKEWGFDSDLGVYVYLNIPESEWH